LFSLISVGKWWDNTLKEAVVIPHTFISLFSYTPILWYVTCAVEEVLLNTLRSILSLLYFHKEKVGVLGDHTVLSSWQIFKKCGMNLMPLETIPTLAFLISCTQN
jgi:hypothetical protein